MNTELTYLMRNFPWFSDKWEGFCDWVYEYHREIGVAFILFLIVITLSMATVPPGLI